MRFTRKNWNKFFDGSNKKTTIRLKEQRWGHHNAWAGSYMHPEKLGEFDIMGSCSLLYQFLSEQDAIEDGFKTLDELKKELVKLNGNIKPDTIYIHWVENPKEQKQ